jgi:hypothetical protein
MISITKYSQLLAQLESGSLNIPNSYNYQIQNPIGALGKYQFMPTTLNYLRDKYNLKDWDNSEKFLKDWALQETYFVKSVIDILSFIDSNNLKQYLNKTISGSMRFKTITTKINIYGMLAGAHLAGTNNLKDYLESGHDPNDGFTSLSDYIAYFSLNLSDLKFNNNLYVFAFLLIFLLYFK